MRFLELFGIADKVLFIDKPIRFKKVIISEASFEYRSYYSKEYLKIFDKVVSSAMKIDTNILPKSKIYFSRKAFNKANSSEFGMEIIDDFFQDNNFEILFPEKLKLEGMIQYIQNADICAMTSGTLPHNMLFAPNKTKIIEIERQAIINKVQIPIDIMKQLDISYIDANYSIYPVTVGGGPFIYAANKYLKNFALDNKMLKPSNKYSDDKYVRENLKKYYNLYRKWYGFGMATEEW